MKFLPIFKAIVEQCRKQHEDQKVVPTLAQALRKLPHIAKHKYVSDLNVLLYCFTPAAIKRLERTPWTAFDWAFVNRAVQASTTLPIGKNKLDEAANELMATLIDHVKNSPLR